MRLLIIGSLGGQIGAASKIAVSRGAKVVHAENVAEALNVLRSGQGADLIMIDVKQNIAQLVESLKSERISATVVACGTETDSKAAVGAIKAGAVEFVPLPPDPELMAAVFQAVSEESHALIAADPRMLDTIRLAEQVAPTEATVLISGESGTGKEVISQQIHRKSRRSGGRFVALNCAAIPENLLESELFGHEKGAFTGAVARRLGKFEEATGGTLLLDEISEMDIRLQAKLLRAIQEREIDRLGGARPVKIDVRLLATTNRDLQKEVREGRFREDLYFRLNVVNITMPSLRARPGDIEVLANHFAHKYAEMNHVPYRPFEPGAITMLKSHSWPGNVRELENVVHRAVIIATSDRIGPDAIMVTPAHGQNEAKSSSGGGSMVGRTVADVERDLIIDTLQHCLGNRTHAANILGISIRTLRNKLNLYSDQGVPVPAPGEG